MRAPRLRLANMDDFDAAYCRFGGTWLSCGFFTVRKRRIPSGFLAPDVGVTPFSPHNGVAIQTTSGAGPRRSPPNDAARQPKPHFFAAATISHAASAASIRLARENGHRGIRILATNAAQNTERHATLRTGINIRQRNIKAGQPGKALAQPEVFTFSAAVWRAFATAARRTFRHSGQQSD